MFLTITVEHFSCIAAVTHHEQQSSKNPHSQEGQRRPGRCSLTFLVILPVVATSSRLLGPAPQHLRSLLGIKRAHN